MKARAFSNATSADLWQSLTAASGKNIQALATNWTEQPGFPLVNVSAQCAADGQRTVQLTQERFLDSGEDQTHARWIIPLRLRTGATGVAQSELFSAQTQSFAAGRCDEALSLNADTVGFYRVQYDAALLATDTRAFATLPITDRFALLDDQWALVRSGREPLASYLKLAGAMGTSLDARAWQQIANALASLEIDEIDAPGYVGFTAYARALIKPVADQLGWTQRPGDSPASSDLRRTLLIDLGLWGDPQVIAEAQRRFALFLKDQRALDADDQDFVFRIVANHANQSTFDALHALGNSATDSALRHRAYRALAWVSDPKLAAEVVAIALSAEILPQDQDLPLLLLVRLSTRHPQLAWQAFSTTEKDLFVARWQLCRDVSNSGRATVVLARGAADGAGGVADGARPQGTGYGKGSLYRLGAAAPG